MSSGRDSFSGRNEGENVADFSNFERPYVIVWEMHGEKSDIGPKHDPNSTIYQPQRRQSGSEKTFSSTTGEDTTPTNGLLRQALNNTDTKRLQAEAEERKRRDYPLWTELEGYLKPIVSTIVVNRTNKQSSQMMTVDDVLKLNRRERADSSASIPPPVTIETNTEPQQLSQTVSATSIGIESPILNRALSALPGMKSPPSLNIPTQPSQNRENALSPSLPSANATQSQQSIIASNVFYLSVEQFTPEFKLSSEPNLHTLCSRHWSAWFTNPYMHIMLVMCDDGDDYKNTIKPKLRDWVSYMNDREYEYVILYVPTPQSESLFKKISLNRVFDKLKNEFNDRKHGVDHVIKVSLNSANKHKQATPLPTQQFKEVGVRIRDGILVEFAHRCAKYEEEIKKFDLNRKLPGWQFCHYFIVKEGLAFTIEQFGLHVNALGIYSQLFSFYITQDDVRLDSFIVRKKKKTTKTVDNSAQVVENEDISDIEAELESFKLCKILDTTAKPYRQMIYNTDITEFDFYNYVFARQIQLFFKMNNPYEAAVHTKQFIPDMVHEMQEHMLPSGNDLPESPSTPKWSEKHLRNFLFIHAWAFSTTQCIVEACQERAFETNAEVLAKLCRTLGDLYVFTRFQLQILSFVFGRNILFSKKPATLSPREVQNDEEKTTWDSIENLPQSLKSPHLLPHIVELTKRFSLETKAKILDSIQSEYDVAIRLKETVRSQEEFSKLYLELSSAASRGYSNGVRGRFYHCLNGEIAEIYFQQGNYREALQLWRNQLAAYYVDAWYDLATEVRIKIAECERLLNQHDEYVNSCLSLLSHKYAYTDEKQKKHYYEELVAKTQGDNVLHSRALSGEFIMAIVHPQDSTGANVVYDDLATDGTDVNVDPLADLMMVDVPVGTTLKLQVQLHNVTLPAEYTIDGISVTFARIFEDSDDEGDAEMEIQEGFSIRHDETLKLNNKKLVAIELSTTVDRRGTYELRKVTMHMGKLDLMIDRILLPGDRDYQQVLFRGVLPPSTTQMNKLPRKFVVTQKEKQEEKKRKEMKRKELDEPVVEQSLDDFITREQPKIPKPLKLPLFQHALSLPSSPKARSTSRTNSPMTPRGDMSPRPTEERIKRSHSQNIASAPATTHTPSASSTPITSIISPLSPNVLAGIPSVSNLQITPRMNNTPRSRKIEKSNIHKKLRVNVEDSPSTLTMQVEMENGCLISGEEQYIIVTINSDTDVTSDQGASLIIESISNEDEESSRDSDDEDDIDITEGGMSARREKKLEEHEMTSDSYVLELPTTLVAIPALAASTTHTIRVPVILRKKPGVESNYCVMRTVRIMVSYQKEKVAPTEPLFVVSQVQPLAFFDPFVYFYNTHQWDDENRPTLLQVTLECTAPCPVFIQDHRITVSENLQVVSDFNTTRTASLMPEQTMAYAFSVTETDKNDYTAELVVSYKISENSPVLEYKVPIRWKPKVSYRYKIQVDVHSPVPLIRVGTPCSLSVKIMRLRGSARDRETPPTPITDHRERRRWWQVSADEEHWMVSGHSRQLFMIDREQVDITHEFECPVIPVTSGYLPLPQIIIERPSQLPQDLHLIQYVYTSGSEIENRVAGNRIFIYPDNDAQMGPFFPLDFPQQTTTGGSEKVPRPHSNSNPMQPLTSPIKKPPVSARPDLQVPTTEVTSSQEPMRHLSDVQTSELLSARRTRSYPKPRTPRNVDLSQEDSSTDVSTSASLATVVPLIEVTPSTARKLSPFE